MDNQVIFQENLSSNRTHSLFIVLMLVFSALFAWQITAHGWQWLAVLFLFFAVLFLFYVFNYRTLIITITSITLHLKFGIFTWCIPIENIEEIYPDDVSLVRIGGAGIHFTSIGGRYRAMFNFLEYPRLVLKLKRKRGAVKDIVFSTQRLEKINHIIKCRLSGIDK